jgi:hypothetical protein
VADAVDILQALDNPVVEELFQQQGDGFTVIGDRRRLLPFLRRRFEVTWAFAMPIRSINPWQSISPCGISSSWNFNDELPALMAIIL